MLRGFRLRLFDRGRPDPDCRLSWSGPAEIRAPLRLPYPPPTPPAQTARQEPPVPLPPGLPLLDPPRQARPMPPLSLLAGTCLGPLCLARNRPLVPGNRPGAADPNWNGARNCRRNADGLPRGIWQLIAISLSPKPDFVVWQAFCIANGVCSIRSPDACPIT